MVDINLRTTWYVHENKNDVWSEAISEQILLEKNDHIVKLLVC
jgi:hypothetical protein